MSGISSLGNDLFNAGAKIITMLANGIKSAAGAVTREVKSIASDITSFLPFSPAKQGPMSGGGSPDISGKKIGTMLAQGMTSSAASVRTAASRLAGAANPSAIGGLGLAYGGAGAGAAYAAGGGQRLILEVQGSDGAFVQFIRNVVRAKGGGGNDSVQRAFGQVR
jgi:hypothetical protein